MPFTIKPSMLVVVFAVFLNLVSFVDCSDTDSDDSDGCDVVEQVVDPITRMDADISR